jgi:DNA-binding transcriptional LysR family regulator
MARQMLTLRQIEVLRAIMVSGTLAGAAKLLNVSAPGLSRLVKYTEQSLGFLLFDRRQGRLVPTKMSEAVFEQINGVFSKVEDLRYVIETLETGSSQELKIASVPSISMSMAPRAVERLRRAHPDLRLEINILKIEEAIDYLLLGKGELVAVSHRIEHPALHFEPLASGELFCIVPEQHELASQQIVSARDIIRHPLIGIDPKDPYGRIMSDIFTRNNYPYDVTIRARFGITVCALVRAGLGVAVMDQFTLAHDTMPGIKILRIAEPTQFDTWIATKVGAPLSNFAMSFIAHLRREMQGATKPLKMRA